MNFLGWNCAFGSHFFHIYLSFWGGCLQQEYDKRKQKQKSWQWFKIFNFILAGTLILSHFFRKIDKKRSEIHSNGRESGYSQSEVAQIFGSLELIVYHR
jgi:hypothetical protein